MNPFLDAYCERAGEAGLFAEPLNLVTNAAFLIAAWLAWRRFAADPAPRLRLSGHLDIAALIGIVFVIGLGSASWHAFPMRATLLADVLPITLFIHLYLVVFVIRVLGLRWYWAVAILAAFIAGGIGFGGIVPREQLGGTAGYLPAYIMLAIVTAVAFAIRNPARPDLVAVLGVWTVSLAARTLDGAVCDAFPLGTHFVWHTLNAVVLFTLVALVVRRAEGARPSGWM